MTAYNTITKLKRRTVSEIEDINVGIIENSHRTNILETNKFRVIKPIKVYVNKVKY